MILWHLAGMIRKNENVGVGWQDGSPVRVLTIDSQLKELIPAVHPSSDLHTCTMVYTFIHSPSSLPPK